MTARVAVPLADVSGQVRASVHHDVALPALPLADVVVDRDAAGRLHDPAEAAVVGAELGQPAGQAAFREGTVLGTVVAVHARGVVAQRRLRAPRRRGRIVFPASAARLLVLAGLGRLQQGETKLSFGSDDLLGRRRGRRQPPVGRIDDQRGACPGPFEGHEHVVVGAGDVLLGATRRTPLPAKNFRSRLVDLGALRLGEELLVRVFRWPLQGRVRFVRPDALQVRFAPRRLRRRSRRAEPPGSLGRRRRNDQNGCADGD